MADNSIYCPWEDWKIVDLIGTGHFGKVFKAVRQDEHTGDEFAAIKIINASDFNVNDVINEINTLRELKNCPNILYIEDYKVIEKDNVYNIYIRTALLTSLNDYRNFHHITEQDVIKLGIEICNALIVCHEKNIIHRDIKPSNILFDKENNSFYLCDFGIAKKFDKSDGHKIVAGTPTYIAPEVYNGIYNKKVDIYSLGLVLYYLMNDYHLPFSGSIEDRKSVRTNYKELQPPANASKELSHIVLKACEYSAADRFETIMDMRRALIELKNGSYDVTEDAPTIQANINGVAERNDYLHNGDSTTEPRHSFLKSKYTGEGVSQTVPLTDNYDGETLTNSANMTNNLNASTLPKDADNWDTLSVGAELTQTIGNENEYLQKPKTKKRFKLSSFVIASLIIILLLVLLVLISVLKNSDFKKKSKLNSKPQEEEVLNEEIFTEETTIDNSQEKESAISAIIDNAEALSNKKSYEEALNKINEGLKEYPDSEKLQKEKKDLEKTIATIQDNGTAINEAKEMADDNKIIEAIHRIEEAISKSESNNVSDDNLSKVLNDYTTTYVKQVSDQANELVDNNKFDDAIKIISDALIELPENNTLSAKKSQIENEKKKYDLAIKKEQILKEAEDAFNSQGYEQAIKIFESVPELSSDQDIKAKIAEYKEYIPISIKNLSSTDKYNTEFVNGVKDPRQQSYNNVISFKSDDMEQGGHIEFYTGQKYSKLTFMFVTDENYNTKKSAGIAIYDENENCLYSYNDITYKTEPFPVEVDISGTKYIKISCWRTDEQIFSGYGLGGKIYLIDPYVSK